MTPGCNGMWGLAHRGWRLKHPARHLAHVLAAAGYHTALAGVQHLGPDVRALGYRETLGAESDHAAVVAGAAERFLDRPPAQPFFLDVGFVETHLLPPGRSPYGPSPFGHPPGDPRYYMPLAERIEAMARTRARAAGSFGSSAGTGYRSSRYSMIARDCVNK